MKLYSDKRGVSTVVGFAIVLSLLLILTNIYIFEYSTISQQENEEEHLELFNEETTDIVESIANENGEQLHSYNTPVSKSLYANIANINYGYDMSFTEKEVEYDFEEEEDVFATDKIEVEHPYDQSPDPVHNIYMQGWFTQSNETGSVTNIENNIISGNTINLVKLDSEIIQQGDEINVQVTNEETTEQTITASDDNNTIRLNGDRDILRDIIGTSEEDENVKTITDSENGILIVLEDGEYTLVIKELSITSR